jgi:hypothetical protein
VNIIHCRDSSLEISNVVLLPIFFIALHLSVSLPYVLALFLPYEIGLCLLFITIFFRFYNSLFIIFSVSALYSYVLMLLFTLYWFLFLFFYYFLNLNMSFIMDFMLPCFVLFFLTLIQFYISPIVTLLRLYLFGLTRENWVITVCTTSFRLRRGRSWNIG